MLAARYAVNVKGPTTIKRKCQGHRCGRTNEVVIRASFEVQRATWKAMDCRCGGAIYLRSDYAGVGFEGWDTDGKSAFDLMVERRTDNQNRTVKTECPRCDCKYTVRIRFTTEDGRVYRSLNGSTVSRCAGCRYRPAVVEAVS